MINNASTELLVQIDTLEWLTFAGAWMFWVLWESAGAVLAVLGKPAEMSILPVLSAWLRAFFAL